MKYLCLIYSDENERDAMPDAEYEACIQESIARPCSRCGPR